MLEKTLLFFLRIVQKGIVLFFLPLQLQPNHGWKYGKAILAESSSTQT